MGLILDMSPRSLEKVLYFASYIVIDGGILPPYIKAIINRNRSLGKPKRNMAVNLELNGSRGYKGDFS